MLTSRRAWRDWHGRELSLTQGNFQANVLGLESLT